MKSYSLLNLPVAILHFKVTKKREEKEMLISVMSSTGVFSVCCLEF